MTARSRRSHNIGAAIIGNTIEWFDILVYAYFVKAIAANFFPAADRSNSLLLAYGTFGLSFVARPLGALVLGRIADRVGRRTALVYASALMFLGTAVIALLPPYSVIGLGAPIALLAARCVQGFSVGGEFGGAAAYLAEQSTGRRALYSSLQFASQGLGMLSAALTGLALSSGLSADQFAEWGWRVPFVIGAVLGPVVYLIRRNADESGVFLEEARPSAGHADTKAPFLALCVVGIGAVLACTVSIYFLVYIPAFAQTSLNAGAGIAYTTAIVSGATMLIGCPLAGLVADRIGVLRHGILAATALIVLTYPVFTAMIRGHDERSILMGQFVLAILTAFYVGPLPAILAELFETRRRSLGLAICYNVAVATAGGFAQMIFVLLIGWTGSIAAPSYYAVSAAAISLISLVFCRYGIMPGLGRITIVPAGSRGSTSQKSANLDTLGCP